MRDSSFGAACGPRAWRNAALSFCAGVFTSAQRDAAGGERGAQHIRVERRRLRAALLARTDVAQSRGGRRSRARRSAHDAARRHGRAGQEGAGSHGERTGGEAVRLVAQSARAAAPCLTNGGPGCVARRAKASRAGIANAKSSASHIACLPRARRPRVENRELVQRLLASSRAASAQFV
jgi:hypothetical protein